MSAQWLTLLAVIVYRGLLTWITLALLVIFTIIYVVIRRRRK
ncbi:MAG TPA: hypothetical protein VJQ45_08785 [Ktedonobacterales bacterium]|nr:hypothetical protein [Ktedonobacterales bacterium]